MSADRPCRRAAWCSCRTMSLPAARLRRVVGRVRPMPQPTCSRPPRSGALVRASVLPTVGTGPLCFRACGSLRLARPRFALPLPKPRRGLCAPFGVKRRDSAQSVPINGGNGGFARKTSCLSPFRLYTGALRSKRSGQPLAGHLFIRSERSNHRRNPASCHEMGVFGHRSFVFSARLVQRHPRICGSPRCWWRPSTPCFPPCRHVASGSAE